MPREAIRPDHDPKTTSHARSPPSGYVSSALGWLTEESSDSTSRFSFVADGKPATELILSWLSTSRIALSDSDPLSISFKWLVVWPPACRSPVLIQIQVNRLRIPWYSYRLSCAPSNESWFLASREWISTPPPTHHRLLKCSTFILTLLPSVCCCTVCACTDEDTKSNVSGMEGQSERERESLLAKS